MKKSSSKLIGILLAVLILTTGCASGAAQAMPTQPLPTLAPTDTHLPPTLEPTVTPAPPTPVPTSPFLGKFPIGKYTNHSTFYATWRLNANGTYNFDYGIPGDMYPGTFTVIGEQISINDNDCGGGITAIYTWSYDGNALTFKSLGDSCATREVLIQTGKWVKEP